MDDFKVMLLSIALKIDEKELEDLKFLCKGKISKRKLEGITRATDLFTALTEMDELSADKLDILEQMLRLIKRKDLVNEVSAYQAGISTQPSVEERGLLDHAFEIICDNIGLKWKMLMRKLGLPENILDRALVANPYSLVEQQMTCLREWKRREGSEANVTVLIRALESCSMKLVADILRDELNVN
ncbi:FAS-associated death domain protein [Spea bombifrons]|uniref:FAS-associated death domain protein n=1 Tax=Spea bombifrons TaxID=233779 RepID=UPI00234A4084|nr:FAS-associated death domain protein [Spea bombifrons]